MDQARPPHEVLIEYVGESLGRRRDAFGHDLEDDLFQKVVLGVTDQLSAYMQCCTAARLSVGRATLRHGATRSYVLIPIADRKGPLRLRDAMRRWDMMATDSDSSLVLDVNGRRWAFVAAHWHSVLRPLLERMADSVVAYYRWRPLARPTVGIIRFCEDVHRTVLVSEIDDRTAPVLGAKETASRYWLQ